jgi:hypothetical protein
MDAQGACAPEIATEGVSLTAAGFARLDAHATPAIDRTRAAAACCAKGSGPDLLAAEGMCVVVVSSAIIPAAWARLTSSWSA